MNPTETEAHEFYSLCRERDCRLTADEVRHWHDRILSLEKRLEEAKRRIEWHEDVGTLAGIIRLVDGNHSLGAGALADAIIGQWTALAGEPHA